MATAASTRSRVLRALLRLLGAGLVLAIGMALLVRWQWDRNMARTLAWYEENVGATDYPSYQPEAVPDEDNLAVLLDAAATSWSDAMDRAGLSEFVQVYYQLPLPGASLESSPEALRESEARARSALEGLSPVVIPLDAMAERVDTSLGLPVPPQDGSSPEWLIRTLALSDLQMTRAALALEQGDCNEAQRHGVTLERMTAVLKREPSRPVQILGSRLESDFLETAQQILEHQLQGQCSHGDDGNSNALLAELDRALAHLNQVRLPFSSVMAAEGSLVTSWHFPRERLLERLAGKNGLNVFASHLALYGQASLAARLREAGADEPRAAPSAQPPRLAIPARWLSLEVISQMLLPSIEYEANREERLQGSRSLTGFLVELSRCQADNDCRGERLSLPTHPSTGEVAHTAPPQDGRVRLRFPIPEEDSVNALREQEYSRIEIPQALLPSP